MSQPQTKPFLRVANTADGQVTIKVDGQDVTFTVRQPNGDISSVSTDKNGMSSFVDGQPRMYPEMLEQRFAEGVKKLGFNLRSKGNLSPDDFHHAALVAFNPESVNDKYAGR